MFAVTDRWNSKKESEVPRISMHESTNLLFQMEQQKSGHTLQSKTRCGHCIYENMYLPLPHINRKNCLI